MVIERYAKPKSKKKEEKECLIGPCLASWTIRPWNGYCNGKGRSWREREREATVRVKLDPLTDSGNYNNRQRFPMLEKQKAAITKVCRACVFSPSVNANRACPCETPNPKRRRIQHRNWALLNNKFGVWGQDVSQVGAKRPRHKCKRLSPALRALCLVFGSPNTVNKRSKAVFPRWR